MKYFKTLGIYKNSTGSNTFNPETKEARSYNHWQYTRVHDGKLIFNNYSYSNSTSKHQGETWRLLNYKADLTLNRTSKSLDNLDIALLDEIRETLYNSELLIQNILKKGTRVNTNVNRLHDFKRNCDHIAKILEIKEFDNKQLNEAMQGLEQYRTFNNMLLLTLGVSNELINLYEESI